MPKTEPIIADIVGDDDLLAIVAFSAATVAYAQAKPAEKSKLLAAAITILTLGRESGK